MYTSFSWETEGAFEVTFELWQASSCHRDAIGLKMRSLKCGYVIGTAYVVTQSHFKYLLRSPRTSVWDTAIVWLMLCLWVVDVN